MGNYGGIGSTTVMFLIIVGIPALIIWGIYRAIRKHNKKVDEQKREENKQ